MYVQVFLGVSNEYSFIKFGAQKHQISNLKRAEQALIAKTMVS
jgi:hypothetical protein